MTEEKMDTSSPAASSAPELYTLKYDLGSKETKIVDVFKSTADRRNMGETTRRVTALEALQLTIDDYKKIVAGPNHIVFLLKDGRVFRLGYTVTNRAVGSTSSTTTTTTTTTTAAAVAVVPAVPQQSTTRHPKYRRVMVSSARRGGGPRTSWLMDRGRPMIPAADVPEDLVAQAQVVLQGKSRDVIVRELQRTNLNVNQAVNNLLSRDDDNEDDDLDERGEILIPEELIAVLEARHQHGGPTSDLTRNLEAIFMPEEGRVPRGENHGKKESKGADSYEEFLFKDQVEFWQNETMAQEEKMLLFTDITACATEIIGLADGKAYGWKWCDANGTTQLHQRARDVAGDSKIVRMCSSYLRVAVLYEKLEANGEMIREIGSWVDPTVIPGKVGMALSQVIPQQRSIDYSKARGDAHFFCTDLYAGFVTQSGWIHWSGIIPPSEKIINFGKALAKKEAQAKQEGRGENEICVGAEVTPKASPIYEAGSVAVMLKDGALKVGVLMERAWTLTESCRFRIVDKSQYDLDFKDLCKEQPMDTEKVGETRKTKANDIELQPQEEWSISEAVFIYEQPNVNLWTVVIHDRDSKQCVVVNPREAPWIDVPRNEISVSHPKFHESKLQIRQVSQLQVKQASWDCTQFLDSPKSIETTRVSLKMPIAYDVLSSVVADEKGLRCLVCTDGFYSILRVSLNGRLLSKHPMPFGSFSVNDSSKQLETLTEHPDFPLFVNFSKKDALFVQTKPNSMMLPMQRMGDGGFKELMSFQQPLCPLQSLWIDSVSNDKDHKNTGSVIIFGLSPPTTGNLLQAVLDCDVKAVRNELGRLADVSEAKQAASFGISTAQNEQETLVFNDLGGNVLHAAVLLASSASNKNQADKPKEKVGPTTEKPEDQKLPRLRSSRANQEVVAALREPEVPAMSPSSNEPMSKLKQRQKDAMEIVALLVDAPFVNKHFFVNILKQKDCNGLNPFGCAIQQRAYSAAKVIWETSLRRKVDINILLAPPPDWASSTDHTKSWALFALAIADTCSYTWTGQTRVKMDVYECRTCNLTGSSCCCAECILTCHKGHSISLKETSSAAYCDCWEKCACKALVSGNLEARMWLFKEIIAKTDYHCCPSEKSQHIIYFLAQTVARQNVEQSAYRRKSHRHPREEAPPNTPEQCLDPPDFATKALSVCLGNSKVLQQFVMEVTNNDLNPNELDNVGKEEWRQRFKSEQLDVTLFLLLTKCPSTNLACLVELLQKGMKRRQDAAGPIVGRIIRAILRIYALLCSLSTTASMVATNGIFTKFPVTIDKDDQLGIGIFNLRRLLTGGSKSDDPKPDKIIYVMNRCHDVLKAFRPYTSLEAARMANGLIHPVVVGRAAAIMPINTKIADSEIFATIEKTLMRKPAAKARPHGDEEEDKQTGDEMDSDHNSLVSSSTFSMNEEEREDQVSDGDESAASFFSDEASEDEDHYDEEENQEENGQDMEHGDENLILAFERLLNARAEGRNRRHENRNHSRRQERQEAGETSANHERVDVVPEGYAAAQESAADSSSEVMTTLPRRDSVETASRQPPNRSPQEAVMIFATENVGQPLTASGNVTLGEAGDKSTVNDHHMNGDSIRHLCSSFYIMARLALEIELENWKNDGGPDSLKLIEASLGPAWKWLAAALDTTEQKITLSKSRQIDVKLEAGNVLKELSEVPTMSSSELLIDLMRSSDGEFGDHPPILNAGLLRPLALLTDVFLLRCRVLDTVRSRKVTQQPTIGSFFERGLNFSYPGVILSEKSSIFDDPLKLATSPLLLQPTSARLDYFNHQSAKMSLENWDQLYEKQLDLELNATSRTTPEENQRVAAPFEKDSTLQLLEVRAESRWSNALECLAKNFHAEIFTVCGREVKKSLLIIGHASYNVRAHYFNQKIFEYSGQNPSKKITLENLSHNAEKLIRDTASQLDAQFLKRLSPRVPPGPVLFASEMKVSYENEPGEGSGVVRAFFSSYAEALMTLRKLPQGTSLQEKQDDLTEPKIDDNAPLFYQMSTGQKVFSMCPGNGTPKRLSNFRNVGRVFGLALVQKQVLPLSLPRHLWRAIAAETSFLLSFHDLAFVDHELYMRLRELIMEKKDEKALTKKIK
ncbi:unnamed protein product, partial [Mesorhabditis belari]|uniref:E3 ubiquitin-protein ligase UBR5 n=1 Tax=Mesorhabditis belari TaxID=2138241 RepID=A0AAF3F1G5_9BILA